MRSSTSRITKSVSISSEPPTENGPCTKKEEVTDEQDEGEARAIAAKVVDDVVRLASATAGQKAAISDGEVEQIRQALQHNNQRRPERLPSILIDTVPSMPPSPTEWPPPPPEDTIPEEDEEEELEETENKTPEEIKEFAATYIQEVLGKAMELAEQKQKSQDEELIREVASQIVDDVITRAGESAVERLVGDLNFPDCPSIQIDTVASMPPSPTDEELQSGQRSSPIPEITYSQYGDDDELRSNEEAFKSLIKFSEAPEEVRNFVSSYVKDVMNKAIIVAEEKIVSAVPFSFDESDLMKVNGPWYVRMREALLRVLRSACFCTPRRDDS